MTSTTAPEGTNPRRERALLALDHLLFPATLFLPIWLAMATTGSNPRPSLLAISWSAWVGVLLIASAMSFALKFGLIVSEPGKREGLGTAALAVAALAAIASTFSMVHGVVYGLAAGVIAVAAWCPMKRYDRYLTIEWTWEHTVRLGGAAFVLVAMSYTFVLLVYILLFFSGSAKGWAAVLDWIVTATSAWQLRRGASLFVKRWHAREKKISGY